MSQIHNYIEPALGPMKLGDVTTRVFEKYYQQLLKARAVPAGIDPELLTKALQTPELLALGKVK